MSKIHKQGAPPTQRTDDEDVVERVHTIDLGEQLVNHAVVDTRAVASAATRLHDGVHFIENDNVQHAVVPHLQLLLLRICEQCTDLLFGTSDELVQHLKANEMTERKKKACQ